LTNGSRAARTRRRRPIFCERLPHLVPAPGRRTGRLNQDRGAVEAAVVLPYSQGQTEGQINRLKTLKRAMCGRANFDLLRKRCLIAA
jgi:transposase